MTDRDYAIKSMKEITFQMASHAENGECMQSRPKYGYLKDPKDKHHLIIDPEAADDVRTVFTMAADGKTKGQILFNIKQNLLNRNYGRFKISHL